MDEQLQEDWLDRRLREELPYIDDAGFTARIVQMLPAPERRQSYRAFILLGITLFASIVTYLASDGGRFLIVAFYRLAAHASAFRESGGDLLHPGHDRGRGRGRLVERARASLGAGFAVNAKRPGVV